jgi:hypothetical protein
MFNVCVLRLTSPVPVSPVISKSDAASKTSTYAVVATFVLLLPAVCVVATEPFGNVIPALGN